MNYAPESQQDITLTTETKILQAAEHEFMLKGYAGARTTAIAEAAGVTHAMLHYYYRTKDKLFEKIITDKLAMLANTFLLSFDADKPLCDCIRTAVENHFELVRENPLLPRFMVCEVFTNASLMDLFADKVSGISGNTVATLQQKINESAAKGECRQVNVISLFMDIISLNVFPILAMPMIKRIGARLPVGDIDGILDARREDNVQTILRKLIP